MRAYKYMLTTLRNKTPVCILYKTECLRQNLRASPIKSNLYKPDFSASLGQSSTRSDRLRRSCLVAFNALAATCHNEQNSSANTFYENTKVLSELKPSGIGPMSHDCILRDCRRWFVAIYARAGHSRLLVCTHFNVTHTLIRIREAHQTGYYCIVHTTAWYQEKLLTRFRDERDSRNESESTCIIRQNNYWPVTLVRTWPNTWIRDKLGPFWHLCLRYVLRFQRVGKK